MTLLCGYMFCFRIHQYGIGTTGAGDGLMATPYEISRQVMNSGEYHYSGMYSTPCEVYVPACVFGANDMACGMI